MNDIRILNAPNGGFIIKADLDNDLIAALSNSGDLIRWITEQFIKPKTETCKNSGWIECKDQDDLPASKETEIEYEMKGGFKGTMRVGQLPKKFFDDRFEVIRYRVVKS